MKAADRSFLSDGVVNDLLRLPKDGQRKQAQGENKLFHFGFSVLRSRAGKVTATMKNIFRYFCPVI